jgi:hypothetical protein
LSFCILLVQAKSMDLVLYLKNMKKIDYKSNILVLDHQNM